MKTVTVTRDQLNELAAELVDANIIEHTDEVGVGFTGQITLQLERDASPATFIELGAKLHLFTYHHRLGADWIANAQTKPVGDALLVSWPTTLITVA